MILLLNIQMCLNLYLQQIHTRNREQIRGQNQSDQSGRTGVQCQTAPDPSMSPKKAAQLLLPPQFRDGLRSACSSEKVYLFISHFINEVGFIY